MKMIIFMVILKVHFYTTVYEITTKNPVLQAIEEELATNGVEIHEDEVGLLVRNEEHIPGDVQLTKVHKSELEDLDISIDELHNYEDVVTMNCIENS